VPGYLRYMDDFMVFGDGPAALVDVRDRLAAFLADRLRLRLKEKAVWLNRAEHGLSFLGMRLFRNFIRVRPAHYRRSRRHVRERLAEWHAGRCSDERMVRSLESITGHLRHFCPRTPVV